MALDVTAQTATQFNHYTADVQTATDYYAFSSPMNGRNFIGANSYRYGFNDKESDDEIDGHGSTMDFGERMYDSRIGRWFSRDPEAHSYASLSPYNFAGNSPIVLKDPDGKKITIYYEDENGKQQSVVISKVSELDVYLNHENNFVRAVVGYLKQITDANTTFVSNIINGEQNIDVYPVLIGGHSGFVSIDDERGNILADNDIVETGQNLILFDAEAVNLPASPAAKEIYEKYKKKLDQVSSKEDISELKLKQRQELDELDKKEKYGVQELTPDESLLHELAHYRHYKNNPQGYARNGQRKDKNFDDKEEKKTIRNEELQYRGKKGKKPRETHTSKGYGRRRYHLNIGRHGKNN